MLHTRFVCSLAIAASLCTFALSGAAQDSPEGGDVQLNSRTRVNVRSRGSSSGLRLAIQGRLDALNLVQASRPLFLDGVPAIGAALMSPLATPGVRLLDTRLFLGLGLGFAGASLENAAGDETSQSGFSLVPTATYDVLSGPTGALSVGGLVTIAHVGQTEDCPQGEPCVESNDDATGIGLTALVGLRGQLTEGLAIGTDLGWGFLSLSADAGADVFTHSVLAMILVEASIGI